MEVVFEASVSILFPVMKLIINDVSVLNRLNLLDIVFADLSWYNTWHLLGLCDGRWGRPACKVSNRNDVVLVINGRITETRLNFLKNLGICRVTCEVVAVAAFLVEEVEWFLRCYALWKMSKYENRIYQNILDYLLNWRFIWNAIADG